MKLVWLSWYISAVLVLLSVTTLLITYAPGVGRLEALMKIIPGAGALISAGVAVWLGRFPRDHWVHRSKPIWALFIAAAVTVTTLLALVG